MLAWRSSKSSMSFTSGSQNVCFTNRSEFLCIFRTALLHAPIRQASTGHVSRTVQSPAVPSQKKSHLR